MPPPPSCVQAKNSPHLSEHIKKKNQCNYTANINYDQKMQLRGIDLEEGGSKPPNYSTPNQWGWSRQQSIISDIWLDHLSLWFLLLALPVCGIRQTEKWINGMCL